MPWGLAIVITLAAAANWYSRRPDREDDDNSPWLEWITKPMVTVGLIFGADLVDAADPAQQRWFLIALAFCLFGDLALMWQPELFRSGLVSFLVGHAAFVAGFAARSEPAPVWSIVACGLVLAACLAVGIRRLLPAVRRRAPRLLGPVAAYISVIAVMAVASWWGGHWAAPTAAAVFAVSDLTLADNKFVAARRWSPLVVMVTYHLALALLVWSLTA